MNTLYADFFEEKMVPAKKCLSTPWFGPKISARMFSYLAGYGRINTYGKKTNLVFETDKLDKVIIVLSGVLATTVVQNCLNKPVFMLGLQTAGRVAGHIGFLTREVAPVRISALTHAKVCFLDFKQLDTLLSEEQNMKDEFLRYCACCIRAETEAVLATTSLCAEERYWVFMAAMLAAFEKAVDSEWIAVPMKLTRIALADLIYVTPLTIDRLLVSLTRQGLMKKHNNVLMLHKDGIGKGMDWILMRNHYDVA